MGGHLFNILVEGFFHAIIIIVDLLRIRGCKIMDNYMDNHLLSKSISPVTRGGRPISRREVDKYAEQQSGMFTVMQQRADFGNGPVDIKVRSARPDMRQHATARAWDSDDSEDSESRPSSVFYNGSSVRSVFWEGILERMI